MAERRNAVQRGVERDDDFVDRHGEIAVGVGVAARVDRRGAEQNPDTRHELVDGHRRVLVTISHADADARVAAGIVTRARAGRSDETARKRFWREARAAASINHPNVCQLYEIGEENGELYIAMELLEGESLSERLRRANHTLSSVGELADWLAGSMV